MALQVRGVVWVQLRYWKIKNMQSKLQTPKDMPSPFNFDSNTAITMTKNSFSMGNAKHFSMWFHMLKDTVLRKKLNIFNTNFENNLVDFFYKFINWIIPKNFKDLLGIEIIFIHAHRERWNTALTWFYKWTEHWLFHHVLWMFCCRKESLRYIAVLY